MKVTAELLRGISTKEKPALIDPLALAMNTWMPAFQINTSLRVRHFLAQACHESDGFRTLTEYASGDAYDTRTDLGNTKAKDGDGRKYKGRGIFQITGKANYAKISKDLKALTFDTPDLVQHPEALAEPNLAVASACIYWDSRKLNALADKDDIRAITKKINGGYNGLADRIKYFERISFLMDKQESTDPRIGPTSSKELIRTLQTILAAKNYQPGGQDGIWGKLTQAAVLALKAENNLDTGDQTILLSEAKAAPARVLELREGATVADLRAKGSQTIKGADKVQTAAAVAGGGGVLAQFSSYLDTGEQASGYFSRIKSVFEPFAGLLPWITDNLGWVVAGVAIVGGFYAYKAKTKRLEEYKNGEIG